ncbi:MAG TPA: hypothetical protein VJO99_27500 [Burkholderiaceae bacterium]|nr:hypothetical protein [Burkholderiaceae bacterium]
MEHVLNYLSTSIAALLATLATATTAVAQQQAEHPMGDHPAVIVKRNWSQRPIDYAATFYPHPAWLYLASDPLSGTTDAPILASVDRNRHGMLAPSARTSAVATSAK